MHYPKHLLKLIDALKRLPGVGNRSAERFAFEMLHWKLPQLEELAHLVSAIPVKLKSCSECGCLIGDEACPFCIEARSNLGVMCVIATPRDAFSIEQTREYKGVYHVLGGLLNPMEGWGPEKLGIGKLLQRIRSLQIKELVLALDSTIEGDATSLYLKREFETLNISISRLAFGIPIGSSLDYVDGGTLARAFSGRARF
jgi:recombination protein RecR